MAKKSNLQADFPDIAKQWHPTKNGDITPDMISAKSKEKYWWLGECGHEWQTQVYVRTTNHGCPYCAGKKVLSGFNDLAFVNPEIAAEWHPNKNGDLKPTMVAPSSNKKVWWLGKCGHEWQTTIDRRKRGDGCPICAKELQTSFPEQALFYYVRQYFEDATNSDYAAIGAELDIYIPSKRIAIEYDGFNWHKNSSFEKEKNSLCQEKGIKLIRIREEGLKLYEDCVCIIRRNRTDKASLSLAILQTIEFLDPNIMPDIDIERDRIDILNHYLSNEKKKSLDSLYPDIAKQWHPTKNGNISPTMVAPNSNKKVWWLGKCGHEWQAVIASRISGNGCPFCNGKKVLIGENDLLTINPILGREWHPTKNGELSPDMVTPNSHRKVWWLGKCGHEWEDTIAHRSNGRNCPFCSRRKILEGFNDLKTTNPLMAAEWHPTKNGALQPTMVSAYSKKRVWWKCKKGHEWETIIKSRSIRNTRCPYCSGNKIYKSE
ncbi:zinc-ribbon domain-containing protein [Lachnobacterium bovis]|uniref:Probable Zinc-ribbon domain-containing protein n=1 Tax=Lachnobacterium bovis TaxID=140626 RepID=A0A1H9T6R9_9FIRM|nr:zinc-ribbon domain-containing protein [Lachnobacterium bovis]SER92950.1 Probable Zinc-ribbon domain-containing protein [Lachnobacterium bovis]